MKLKHLLVCLSLAACAAPSSQENKDGGSGSDAGAVDAGTQADSGPMNTDGGATDAGMGDAWLTDAGPVDGGTSDAGSGARWTVSGDQVADSVTGLSWDLTGGPGGTTFGSSSGHYTWQEARDYCAQKSARLATYTDDGTSESEVLSAAAKADWSAFTAAFGGAWNSWSATEVDGVPTKAWHYYIDNTNSAVGYRGLKDDGYSARCVR